MQEDVPRLHPGHFSNLQTREFDPYWNDWMAPTFAKPGPARALDFMNARPPTVWMPLGLTPSKA